MAEGAATYVNLPEAERGEFIDKWVVEWIKFAEHRHRCRARVIPRDG